MSRTLAREAAFRALFQLDFNPGNEDEREDFENLAIENVIEKATENESKKKLSRENLTYIDVTVRGARSYIKEIDEIISAHLQKSWTLARINSADRNILRLAVYELKFAEKKLPIGVIINEAVELAKRYGTDNSGAFVNGVLNTVAH